MATISDRHVLDTDVYTVLRKASLKALSALQQTLFFFFPHFSSNDNWSKGDHMPDLRTPVCDWPTGTGPVLPGGAGTKGLSVRQLGGQMPFRALSFTSLQVTFQLLNQDMLLALGSSMLSPFQ